MQQQSSFKIDGYILKSILANTNAMKYNGCTIQLYNDRIELRASKMYIKIPSTLLKEYILSPEVSNLHTYSGFNYVSELPKKHGTDICMRFINNNNMFQSEIQINSLKLTTNMTINENILLDIPRLENIDSTIVIHSMNMSHFVQMMKKQSDLYIGSIGDEVRVGTSTDSYLSFIGTHNGDDVGFYLYKQRKLLNKFNIKEADSLIIDIDIEHSIALFKWIVDKVLYMITLRISIQR